ncbi:MAG: hypothetical protein OXI33_01190 [Chloroflexota bacterium]|nr:hypothetical protein [Chloroflexota bacterium]
MEVEETRAEDKLLNYHWVDPVGAFRTLVVFHIAIAHAVSQLGEVHAQEFLRLIEDVQDHLESYGPIPLSESDRAILNLLRVELKDDVGKAKRGYQYRSS